MSVCVRASMCVCVISKVILLNFFLLYIQGIKSKYICASHILYGS